MKRKRKIAVPIDLDSPRIAEAVDRGRSKEMVVNIESHLLDVVEILENLSLVSHFAGRGRSVKTRALITSTRRLMNDVDKATTPLYREALLKRRKTRKR